MVQIDDFEQRKREREISSILLRHLPFIYLDGTLFPPLASTSSRLGVSWRFSINFWAVKGTWHTPSSCSSLCLPHLHLHSSWRAFERLLELPYLISILHLAACPPFLCMFVTHWLGTWPRKINLMDFCPSFQCRRVVVLLGTIWDGSENFSWIKSVGRKSQQRNYFLC